MDMVGTTMAIIIITHLHLHIMDTQIMDMDLMEGDVLPLIMRTMDIMEMSFMPVREM
jgi:hypothetical protein